MNGEAADASALESADPSVAGRAQKWVPVLAWAVLGSALGVIGARYLFVGSALSLLPWGIVAVAIGCTSSARADVLARAGCYGFVLAFVFMLAGYSGRAAVAAELLIFVVLGLFGALCAVLLAYAGFVAGARARRS